MLPALVGVRLHVKSVINKNLCVIKCELEGHMNETKQKEFINCIALFNFIKRMIYQYFVYYTMDLIFLLLNDR